MMRPSHVGQDDEMQDDAEKERTQAGITRARIFGSLAIGACVTLFAAECSKSPVQETVTVAPRATAKQAQATQATTDASSTSAPSTVDAESETAGDVLAHAIVALKARRRDEALYYINLARAHLTRCLNRAAAGANANSNSTREHLTNALRELDIAERSARHNAYDQSRTQLLAISNELDHLHQKS